MATMTTTTTIAPAVTIKRSNSTSSTSSNRSTVSFSLRPRHSRRSSRDAYGWYNTDGHPTLEDFAQQLETAARRFEIWQGRCAQNVVMALLRPTPVVLFVFNPICLILFTFMLLVWVGSKLSPR